MYKILYTVQKKCEKVTFIGGQRGKQNKVKGF